ncbi:MAG TPA: glycosyltransferase 87 family protein [Motilibacteraceae bacterium]|nr:glycosyltransferase 87 family protein [Motilibacteraceae bacterium]
MAVRGAERAAGVGPEVRAGLPAGPWRGALWWVAGLLALAVGAWSPVGSALRTVGYLRLVDLEVYRAAGTSVLTGEDVYGHLTPLPSLLPSTYPAFAALLAVPLALIPAGAVDVLWTLAQLVVLGWVVKVAFAPLLRTLGPAWPLGLGAITGASCWLVPLRDNFYFGQVDIFLMALCLADLTGAWARVRPGVLSGWATAVKLTPGLFVVHWWLAGDRRAAVRAALTAVLLTVATALVLPGATAGFWGGAIFASDRLGDNTATANQSLRGVLLRVGPSGAVGSLLYVVLAAACLVLFMPVAARAHRAGQRVRAAAVVGLVAFVVSPVSWIHHAAWVVVALGVLVGAGRTWWRWLAAAAVSAFWGYSLPALGAHLLLVDPAGPWGRVLQQADVVGALGVLALLALIPESPQPPLCRDHAEMVRPA